MEHLRNIHVHFKIHFYTDLFLFAFDAKIRISKRRGFEVVSNDWSESIKTYLLPKFILFFMSFN